MIEKAYDTTLFILTTTPDFKDIDEIQAIIRSKNILREFKQLSHYEKVNVIAKVLCNASKVQPSKLSQGWITKNSQEDLESIIYLILYDKYDKTTTPFFKMCFC